MFIKTTNKWRAYIGINYSQITIGTYSTKEEAVKARNKVIADYPELGFSERHGT